MRVRITTNQSLRPAQMAQKLSAGADGSNLFTFTRYDRVVLEDLNKKAKKAGLHVANAKKPNLYSVRKVKNGKLVAKNVDADEAFAVIKKYK